MSERVCEGWRLATTFLRIFASGDDLFLGEEGRMASAREKD
jgi:hypothetical protein